MRKYRSRAPNAHAVATGNRIRAIRASNPGISPQQALAMASHQTSRSGTGLHLHPYGSGLHMAPIGTGLYRRRRRYY